MYGVTPDGFIKKDFNTILEENSEKLRSSFGNDIDLSGESPLGLLNNIHSLAMSSLWNLGEGVYNSEYQEFAEGVPLDNAMDLSNNERLPAIKSTVIITITGTPFSLISAGFRGSVSGNPSIVFETLEDVTIEAGGTVDTEVTAVESGSKIALAGSLIVIETPVFGVDSITNDEDADIGRDTETDAEFKLRAKFEKQKVGTSPAEGIRRAILKVSGVLQVLVNQNRTDLPNGEGRPPHSIEAVVQGGDSIEIAQKILDSGAGGVETFGSVTEEVLDDQGIPQEINFNRPIEKLIYIIVNIVKNTDLTEGPLYPSDGDDQIKNAIVLYGDDFLIGRDVLKDGSQGLTVPINTVAGIRQLEVLFGLEEDPEESDPVEIESNELAIFSSINMEINSV